MILKVKKVSKSLLYSFLSSFKLLLLLLLSYRPDFFYQDHKPRSQTNVLTDLGTLQLQKMLFTLTCVVTRTPNSPYLQA